MTNGYTIRSPIFLTCESFGLSLVRDAPPEQRKQNVDFHIASDDYFGTLATIMGLMADSLSSNDAGAQKRCVKTLNELREDLKYSQEHYTIRRK